MRFTCTMAAPLMMLASCLASGHPPIGRAEAVGAQQGRSLMVWLNEWTGPPGPQATWEARLADIAAHAQNLTHVSPCIHELTAAGTFGNQDGKAQGSYDDIAPHLARLQQLGLAIIPIIYNVGGAAAQVRLHDGAAPGFIKAAVAKAVAMGYDGYNFDNELRGGTTEASWVSAVHTVPCVPPATPSLASMCSCSTVPGVGRQPLRQASATAWFLTPTPHTHIHTHTPPPPPPPHTPSLCLSTSLYRSLSAPHLPSRRPRSSRTAGNGCRSWTSLRTRCTP